MRISDWSSDVCSSDLDTKEEGLFSPCNHSHNGAVRRGGFGTMKTILLPVEEQPSVEPTIDTAVLLAAVFGSYVEGFALTPDPPLLVSAAAFSGAMIRSEEHTSELQSLMRISYAVFCL